MDICINDSNYKVKVCKSFFDRFMGMMFKYNKIKYGFCFKNCSSIHTFFMFQNIDVIGCDKNYNVIYVRKNVKPWKVIFLKGCFCILEFSENVVSAKVGDKVKGLM